MAANTKAKTGKSVKYEIWWGGTDLRYREALTEDDAYAIADEFIAEAHPNVFILKITTISERIKAKRQ